MNNFQPIESISNGHVVRDFSGIVLNYLNNMAFR